MFERCNWCKNTFEQYIRYHDEEWGVPVHNDKYLFEFLILETAQAGLSWSTILKKREGYRQAFADFDVEKVAAFDEEKIQELLNNSAIVRNKLKIRSAMNNARRFIEIQDEYGSFNDFIWQFVNGQPIQNNWEQTNQIPVNTKTSDQLSQALKERGFKFVGSTTMYAYMQAVGMVNDHVTSCFRHSEIRGLAN